MAGAKQRRSFPFQDESGFNFMEIRQTNGKLSRRVGGLNFRSARLLYSHNESMITASRRGRPYSEDNGVGIENWIGTEWKVGRWGLGYCRCLEDSENLEKCEIKWSNIELPFHWSGRIETEGLRTLPLLQKFCFNEFYHILRSFTNWIRSIWRWAGWDIWQLIHRK